MAPILVSRLRAGRRERKNQNELRLLNLLLERVNLLILGSLYWACGFLLKAHSIIYFQKKKNKYFFFFFEKGLKKIFLHRCASLVFQILSLWNLSLPLSFSLSLIFFFSLAKGSVFYLRKGFVIIFFLFFSLMFIVFSVWLIVFFFPVWLIVTTNFPYLQC